MLSMRTARPSRRKQLNPEQRRILYALYKFRFGTTDLLRTTQHKSITRRYINTRLRILCEQEYIGRHYDSSNRQHAPYATYFLLPKGITYLKESPADFQKNMLRNIQKDREQSPSSRFIRHNLAVFATYAQLIKQYGGTFKFYTKSYLSLPAFDSLPEKRPDAFVAGSFGTPTAEQYIIECLDDTMPYSIMKQKIARLVDHADGGIWPSEKPYPTLLFVCQNEQLKKHVQRWATKTIADGWTP
ncbi:MAG: replication-relaxation family protein, partial [Candidatus Micrarchaeaceae archaeon]